MNIPMNRAVLSECLSPLWSPLWGDMQYVEHWWKEVHNVLSILKQPHIGEKEVHNVLSILKQKAISYKKVKILPFVWVVCTKMKRLLIYKTEMQCTVLFTYRNFEIKSWKVAHARSRTLDLFSQSPRLYWLS